MQNRILSVGSTFPSFNKKAVISIEYNKEFSHIDSKELFNNGNGQ